MGSLLCRDLLEDNTFYEIQYFPGVPRNKKKREEIFYDCIIEVPNYIAIANYEKRQYDEINLIKNDTLILLRGKNESDKCVIKNLRTKLIGKVPAKAIRPYSHTRVEE